MNKELKYYLIFIGFIFTVGCIGMTTEKWANAYYSNTCKEDNAK